uniref:ribonuclease H n=1 Tax=Hippocampus comes TaxID=109280 RepID=A0A3Q2XGQ9_HIPCM
MCPHPREYDVEEVSNPPNSSTDDFESVLESLTSSVPTEGTIIFQGTHKVLKSDSLFYTTATIAGVSLTAMIDSGSTGCTLSESAMARLLECNPDMRRYPADDVVIVGCGGHRVTPSAICDVEMVVYDCKLAVPMFVVPGQTDDIILGSNAIKKILHLMRKTEGYWRLMSEPGGIIDDDSHHFFSLLSNTERWRGVTAPDKVGTLKLRQCVMLQPKSEHLVWAKLPASAPMSVGSTVIVEPTQSRCRSRKILVGRVIAPMWGDGWLPVRVINPSSEQVVLKRNAKLADVFPCIAVEDLSEPDNIQMFSQTAVHAVRPRSKEDIKMALDKLGLQDLDLDACAVSDMWRDRLFQIIERYESVFSRNKMDCGEASDFVHKIHLVDERPFRLPYRRVPPSQYEKLRMTLNEMEEKGIIRKSTSEYASPLVLVWKKNGDLRICTDFRWLNARTQRDAHPLPHQADALAALGGNVFFSTMDLTSGFYNVPLFEDHKKYTAFSSPFGLHEYNRMPQGLSNSPATFMRMMLSIFGDKNFTSLLCYLDDLMVFGPTEQSALERLEMVFSRLKNHNLRLAPKKCHFLRRSVKFLGHVISESGVQTDPGKVEAINRVRVSDLMDSDGLTPSLKKIRSFLGMVLYYQHFIEDCSIKAKPLLKLLSGQKTGGKARRRAKPALNPLGHVKLRAEDWTTECQSAFETLKHDLSQSVTLAHPDFGK